MTVKKPKQTSELDTSSCPLCGATRDQKERGMYKLYQCGSVFKEGTKGLVATKKSIACLEAQIASLKADSQVDLDLIDGAAKEAAMTIKLACDWAAGLAERTEPLESVIDRLIQYVDTFQGMPDVSEKSEFEWEEMSKEERRNQWRRDIFKEMGVNMAKLGEIDATVEKQFVDEAERTLKRLANWKKKKSN